MVALHPSTAFAVLVIILLVPSSQGIQTGDEVSGAAAASSPVPCRSRKLLQPGEEDGINKKPDQPDRYWGFSSKCSSADIVINQGPTAPLPNGIPTYTVEILNACLSGCDIGRIHLRCGWFSSARLVNPKLFKRLRYDDCIVNDGKPLRSGGSISFQYANTFPYRLSVSSVGCP